MARERVGGAYAWVLGAHAPIPACGANPQRHKTGKEPCLDADTNPQIAVPSGIKLPPDRSRLPSAMMPRHTIQDRGLAADQEIIHLPAAKPSEKVCDHARLSAQAGASAFANCGANALRASAVATHPPGKRLALRTPWTRFRTFHCRFASVVRKPGSQPQDGRFLQVEQRICSPARAGSLQPLRTALSDVPNSAGGRRC